MELIEKPRTSTFSNLKGQRLFFRNWITDNKPRGIILIIHGLNSHSAYYQNFALELNKNNYEVYALDLPGRGRSEGERYYINDYKEIIADIDQLLKIIQTAHPLIPVVLFGHSAGGVFAAVYALLYQAKLKAFICESFAFKVPAPGFALAIMRLLGHITPHSRLIKLKNEDFSRDKSFVYRMNQDSLIKDEKQPARSMQQLLLAGDCLKKRMAEIMLPLLILHGTADRVTKPDGSKYFVEQASSPDKQLKFYEGHYHDLLNDKYNGIVMRDIIKWLNGVC
ncbi:alpha/beta hydrolase [Mucilaginibacter aquaedulcis]|uniref:alpha/beta hydrolase n=1 Tax=Mucilaginibacter aquaedulcis TaxID=1187081 RepID=UPI0025B451B2|nr:alpha/beta hydrolase [Mucilaginibacter aquaedulcis]MDN3549169.1 lysophospholipase [Mucilaginibacter aquaedulcis]